MLYIHCCLYYRHPFWNVFLFWLPKATTITNERIGCKQILFYEIKRKNVKFQKLCIALFILMCVFRHFFFFFSVESMFSLTVRCAIIETVVFVFFSLFPFLLLFPLSLCSLWFIFVFHDIPSLNLLTVTKGGEIAHIFQKERKENRKTAQKRKRRTLISQWNPAAIFSLPSTLTHKKR